jgi:hypothetical protein
LYPVLNPVLHRGSNKKPETLNQKPFGAAKIVISSCSFPNESFNFKPPLKRRGKEKQKQKEKREGERPITRNKKPQTRNLLWL